MKEKTYTLTILQTGTYQYKVTVPEIGVTKIAPTLVSALTIAVNNIFKHLMAHYLILVVADHQPDRYSRCVNNQECPQEQFTWLNEQLGMTFERYYVIESLHFSPMHYWRK